MKTKIYILLSGLLMAACISSYGQEIVGFFASTTNSWDCNLVEATDGSILVGSQFGNRDYMILKLSPEGLLLDSIFLPGTAQSGESQFMEIPSIPDYFIAAFFRFNNSFISLKFIIVDASLNIVNESNYTLQVSGNYSCSYMPFTATPNKCILYKYNDLSGDEHESHIVRFTIQGSFIEDIALTETPPFPLLKVFNETPLTFSGIIGYSSNDAIHLANNIFDNDFNQVDLMEYEPISQDKSFASLGAALTFMQPDEGPHILATSTTNSYGQPVFTLIKYDCNGGTPLAYHQFTEYNYYGFFSEVALKDPNTLYLGYGTTHHGESQHLLRLNSNLDVTGDYLLPCPNALNHWIQTIKVLHNGDIAIGVTAENSQIIDNRFLQVFIIRDNDPTSISETASFEKPFTFIPNPVKNQLTLRFDDGFEPESVELYDLAGRLVGTKPNGLESIDMTAMPSGVYLMRVTMKDGTRYHEKVLKE